MGFHDGCLHRLVADAMVARPPSAEPGREHFEGARLACIDPDGFAHRRDGDV
jgi:hypothetical protein